MRARIGFISKKLLVIPREARADEESLSQSGPVPIR
jgi:hypothetical protein